MSQLTIYLPDAVLRKLRSGARRARKSVSAYVTELLERREKREQWPKGFRELYGSCRGTLPDVDDLEPEAGPEL
jgi:macrodomain Ter protein organizer (MatP/YcbG family)